MTATDDPSDGGAGTNLEDRPPSASGRDQELLGNWDRASRDRVLFFLVLGGLAAIVLSVPVRFSTPRLLQLGMAALLGLAGAVFPSRFREHASRWVALAYLAVLAGLEYLARPEDVGYLVGFLVLVLAGVLADGIARKGTS